MSMAIPEKRLAGSFLPEERSCYNPFVRNCSIQSWTCFTRSTKTMEE